MVRRAEDAVDIADGEARRHEAHVDAERIELALQPTGADAYPPRCNGTGFVTKQGTHAPDVSQAEGIPCPVPMQMRQTSPGVGGLAAEADRS